MSKSEIQQLVIYAHTIQCTAHHPRILNGMRFRAYKASNIHPHGLLGLRTASYLQSKPHHNTNRLMNEQRSPHSPQLDNNIYNSYLSLDTGAVYVRREGSGAFTTNHVRLVKNVTCRVFFSFLGIAIKKGNWKITQPYLLIESKLN